MNVERNAFGRQRESFETDLEIIGFDAPYHAIFIRAPVVTWCGPGVETLSKIEKGIVAVRMDRHYAWLFIRELSKDPRIHVRFIQGLCE